MGAVSANNDDDDFGGFFGFFPGTLVLSRSVYQVHPDGTVDLYAITSTISANGHTGADPNKLVKVTDILSATTLPTPNSPGSYWIDRFITLRSARAGEVFRGIAFAPQFGGFGESH